jgi:phosphopantothenoylcysteine decarboxylase/phosphopantothenate--cysteine ligase
MNILLGVCGGIAAYKSAYLASLLFKESFDVKTVMTGAAVKFVAPLTFRALTNNRVYTDLFDEEISQNHTSLSRWADMIVVAPATASTIAKIAGGFADDLLSAVILDYTGPVFLCPAMHENMWNNPAVRENVNKLTQRSFHIIGPETGDLAGGKKGIGRMTEPQDILTRIKDIIKKSYPKLLS